jgi:hypothetical protein
LSIAGQKFPLYFEAYFEFCWYLHIALYLLRGFTLNPGWEISISLTLVKR